MASEIFSARESSVSSLNGVANGGRNVPRLYNSTGNERYPARRSLGITTRDETAQKDRAVLEGVLGQLSDGIWENSSAMEKYWREMEFSQDDKGNVGISFNPQIIDRVLKWKRGVGAVPDYKRTQSGYSRLTDKGVRDFIADKIKAVFNTERKDYPSLGKWSSDNMNIMDYLGGEVTVADAYSLHKRLKG